MRKQPFIIILFFLVTSFAYANETEPARINEANHRAEIIINRVEEIRSMDRSELSSEEKKALKTELKELKKEAREMGLDSRISISIGAVIIIILLLILIL